MPVGGLSRGSLNRLDDFIFDENARSIRREKYEESQAEAKNTLIKIAVISFFSILFLSLVIIYFYNLTKKLRNLQKELEVRATTDKLTGLYNRQKLDETMTARHTETERYGSALSVVIIDIDHFKSVNDNFGHQVGDCVLSSVSSIIGKNIRAVDTLGRWGGEEFLLICPQTNITGASKIAEHLCSAVANAKFDIGERVTISLGVAEYEAKESIDSLLSRADASLYSAKAAGRNCVKIALRNNEHSL